MGLIWQRFQGKFRNCKKSFEKADLQHGLIQISVNDNGWDLHLPEKKNARYADHVAGHQIRNTTCDTPRKKETTLATFSKPQVAGLFFKSFWWRQVPFVPSSAWIFIGFSRWITFHQKMEMKRWRWNHLPNAFHGARERPTDGRN